MGIPIFSSYFKSAASFARVLYSFVANGAYICALDYLNNNLEKFLVSFFVPRVEGFTEDVGWIMESAFTSMVLPRQKSSNHECSKLIE